MKPRMDTDKHGLKNGVTRIARIFANCFPFALIGEIRGSPIRLNGQKSSSSNTNGTVTNMFFDSSPNAKKTATAAYFPREGSRA